jgi:hypothetical protein
MRKLGIGVAGLVAGLLVAFGVVEVITRVALDDPSRLDDSLPLALLLGFITPVLAIVGVVVALAIDNRSQRRGGSSSPGTAVDRGREGRP